MNLLIVMPALNEEATVVQTIQRIPQQMAGIKSIRVLVVDDGSVDNTAAISRAAGAEVISHGMTRGVGSAFQTALDHALHTDADLVVSIDSDGQFNPETIPQLIAPILADEADFATASRFADPLLIPQMPAIKLWGNRMMSRLISRLIHQKFHDVSCGMRCYNRRAALSLNTIGRFTYTQEVFLNLAFKGLRMVEVPILVEGQRKHGKSRVASSIIRYAWNTSWIIFRCYRDYRPMRFFGRLAAMFMASGVILELFLLGYYLFTQSFTPHKWAGFTGAGLFVLGLMLLTMGIIGDMLDRHRIYLEEILYHFRSTKRLDRNEKL